MSLATAAPAATTQQPQAPSPAPAAPPFTPQVRGESLYDRVTSGLIASVTGALLVFGWLTLVWMTQDAYAGRVTAPIEVIDVIGGGGGSPDGTPDLIEDIPIPGAEASGQASNNDTEAADYEEPSVMASPEATIDNVADIGDAEMESFDIDVPNASGGAIATGRRASKIGTGGPGFGNGPGDGGIRSEDRWSVIYPPGQTIDEYARQLDSLGVELGTTSGNSLQIAAKFSSASPTKRSVLDASSEKRLFFLWQGGSRRGNDIELLKKAGIIVGNFPVFQFYPKEVENTLKQLEVKYKGRQPIEIRSTKFLVVPTGGKYGFKVTGQEPLR